MAEKYALPAGATAADFAARRWGGPIGVDVRLVTVGTTLTELVRNNPRRVLWLVQNRGAGDLSTALDRAVTTANGFLLSASGGLQSMDAEEDGEAVTYPLFAIGAAAGNVVRVLEVFRV